MSTEPHASLDVFVSADRSTVPLIAHAQDQTLRLFDEHHAALRRYLRALGVAPDAADDIVQETFLSLFRHLCLDRPQHNLKAWLFQVAYRLALKHRYRKVSQSSRENAIDLNLSEALIDPARDPEMTLCERERSRRLRSVVNALPARARQCLLLRAEGVRYRDIARILRISLGGVAKQLALAIERLSNAVKE
jgi:RNA polymerase sigma-70 factor, ECF subfamily